MAGIAFKTEFLTDYRFYWWKEHLRDLYFHLRYRTKWLEHATALSMRATNDDQDWQIFISFEIFISPPFLWNFRLQILTLSQIRGQHTEPPWNSACAGLFTLLLAPIFETGMCILKTCPFTSPAFLDVNFEWKNCSNILRLRLKCERGRKFSITYRCHFHL